MDVTPLITKDRQVIQSYAGGSFRVSGEIYESAIIVAPSVTTAWCGEEISTLKEGDFDSLVAQADEIDVVLLGCGARMQFLDPALKKSLSEKGLLIDVMDTGAACRTYNVLMAEGRRVVAALLPAS